VYLIPKPTMPPISRSDFLEAARTIAAPSVISSRAAIDQVQYKHRSMSDLLIPPRSVVPPGVLAQRATIARNHVKQSVCGNATSKKRKLSPVMHYRPYPSQQWSNRRCKPTQLPLYHQEGLFPLSRYPSCHEKLPPNLPKWNGHTNLEQSSPLHRSFTVAAENNFAAIEDNSYKNTVSIDIRKFTQMNGNPLPYKTSQHKTSNRRQSTQIPFEKKHLSSKPVQERYSIKKPFKNEQHHYSSPQGLSQQYIPEQNLQPPNPKILNLADRINRFAANIGLRLSPDLRPREKISLLEIETIGQEQEGNIVSRMITMENILEQLMTKN